MSGHKIIEPHQVNFGKLLAAGSYTKAKTIVLKGQGDRACEKES